MNDGATHSDFSSSNSDYDDLLEDSWSLNKRKKLLSLSNVTNCSVVFTDRKESDIDDRNQKFRELQSKSSAITLGSAKRQHKTEERRSKKLIKKALRDPEIKAIVGNKTSESSSSENAASGECTKWIDIKPFLSVNDHMRGPISHGDCGPKTELEYMVEDCIEEGDFEKAEVLSDTLANREFAVKIANAFAAKRYQEKLDQDKAAEQRKQAKKIRGIFDAKERWQMKGNM